MSDLKALYAEYQRLKAESEKWIVTVDIVTEAMERAVDAEAAAYVRWTEAMEAANDHP